VRSSQTIFNSKCDGYRYQAKRYLIKQRYPYLIQTSGVPLSVTTTDGSNLSCSKGQQVKASTPTSVYSKDSLVSRLKY
jgi:hypothetical protein